MFDPSQQLHNYFIQKGYSDLEAHKLSNKVQGRCPRFTTKRKTLLELIKVDECDKPILEKYNWEVSDDGYVIARIHHKDGALLCTLHLSRLIMGAPNDLVVHHKNRDKLDNRRCNLITLTISQHHSLRSNPKVSGES